MSTGAVTVAVSRPAQFVALALVPLAHSWCCGGHRAKTFDRSADCTSCKNWLLYEYMTDLWEFAKCIC